MLKRMNAISHSRTHTQGLHEMRRRLAASDVVIEVHDARIPFTGRNRNFEFFHENHILVLNKADCVEKRDRQQIAEL